MSQKLIVSLHAVPREFVDAAAWKARLAEAGRRAFSALPNRHSHGGSHGFKSSSAHLLALREMEPLVRRFLHPVFAAFSQLFRPQNWTDRANAFPAKKAVALRAPMAALMAALGNKA